MNLLFSLSLTPLSDSTSPSEPFAAQSISTTLSGRHSVGGTKRCLPAGLAVALVIAWCATSLITPQALASPEVSVLTYHNDNSRTGQNLNETKLTLANVNVDHFGKWFSCPVDGFVYAQPLILAGVEVPGKGVRTLLFIATEHDSVYAFDADNSSDPIAFPVWQVSFINPAVGITSFPTADIGLNEPAEIGITGTPVLDPDSGTLFVVSRIKQPLAPTYAQRLHALDVATGAEKFGGPVLINVSVPGVGDGSDGTLQVPFDSLYEFQRPGLALSGGVVYITFASAGDIDPYHGWVLGYDAHTLQLVRAFNDTPNGSRGGIWMSGAAPAVDAAGNLYCSTGNGSFDEANAGFGDTVLKLTPSGRDLLVTDYFTPFNQQLLESTDADLGSGGCLLLPNSAGSAEHPHLMVTAGKEGTIYLLDRDSMGRFNSLNDSQIVQELPTAIGGLFGMPAYFDGMLFFQGYKDVLKAFRIANGRLSSQPTQQSTVSWKYPNGTPSVSANGNSNAIIWIIEADTFYSKSSPVLRAYNATSLTQELYNSNQASQRDQIGVAQKFAVPTVANGKVYVASANLIGVYGNLEPPTVSAQPLVQLSASGEDGCPIVGGRFWPATDPVPMVSRRHTNCGSHTVRIGAHQCRYQRRQRVHGAGQQSLWLRHARCLCRVVSACHVSEWQLASGPNAEYRLPTSNEYTAKDFHDPGSNGKGQWLFLHSI